MQPREWQAGTSTYDRALLGSRMSRTVPLDHPSRGTKSGHVDPNVRSRLPRGSILRIVVRRR